MRCAPCARPIRAVIAMLGRSGPTRSQQGMRNPQSLLLYPPSPDLLWRPLARHTALRSDASSRAYFLPRSQTNQTPSIVRLQALLSCALRRWLISRPSVSRRSPPASPPSRESGLARRTVSPTPHSSTTTRAPVPSMGTQLRVESLHRVWFCSRIPCFVGIQTPFDYHPCA